ncbi:MAG: hypothetical protein P8105_01805 [Dehalococcoidia bacterium]
MIEVLQQKWQEALLLLLCWSYTIIWITMQIVNWVADKKSI